MGTPAPKTNGKWLELHRRPQEESGLLQAYCRFRASLITAAPSGKFIIKHIVYSPTLGRSKWRELDKHMEVFTERAGDEEVLSGAHSGSRVQWCHVCNQIYQINYLSRRGFTLKKGGNWQLYLLGRILCWDEVSSVSFTDQFLCWDFELKISEYAI